MCHIFSHYFFLKNEYLKCPFLKFWLWADTWQCYLIPKSQWGCFHFFFFFLSKKKTYQFMSASAISRHFLFKESAVLLCLELYPQFSAHPLGLRWVSEAQQSAQVLASGTLWCRATVLALASSLLRGPTLLLSQCLWVTVKGSFYFLFWVYSSLITLSG